MRHNSILSTCLVLLVALGILSSCSSDNPFSGSDDFLLDLQLEGPEGTTYVAQIRGNNITIELPKDVDPATVKPVYHISERATIAPKPETVTDWSQETTFVVTSYSGDKRSYAYHPVIVQAELKGQVVLTTDEEVETFAQKQIGIIWGNLIIGEKVPSGKTPERVITTLAPLSHLREVIGTIIVRDSYQGDFNELTSLERIGGLLFDQGINKKIREISLPELRYVGQAIQATTNTKKVYADSLVTLSLPKLHSAGAIRLEAPRLRTVDLGSMEEVGDLTLCTHIISSLDLSSLRIASSVWLEDKISYEQDARADLAELALPHLTECEGELRIVGFPSVTHLDLAALTEVGGALELSGLPKLEGQLELPQLQSAKSLHSTVYLTSEMENHRLKSISLPKLRVVTEDINLEKFYNLESLSLPAMTELKLLSVSSTVTSLSAPLLERVTSSLTTPVLNKDDLPLLKEAKMIRLNPLNSGSGVTIDVSSIETIGSLVIIDCGKDFTVITPKSIGDLLYTLRNQPSLPHIEGLESCRSVAYNNAYQIKGKVSLPVSLRSVSESISCSGMSYCTSFSGPALEKVGSLSVNVNSAQEISFPKLVTATNVELYSRSLVEVTLTALETVGTVVINGRGNSEMMTKLPDFPALVEVDKVEIGGFPKMTDFTGIRRAMERSAIKSDGWEVEACGYNPTYEDLKAGRYTE